STGSRHGAAPRCSSWSSIYCPRRNMLTQEQHLQNAALLVRAMMSSASSKKIRRIEWWERAKSALETAAMSSDSFPSLVSTMARKLQIDCTTIATASDVVLLGEVVAHDFEAFRRFCER